MRAESRDSNFELLRIIAMLMVLTLHAIEPLKWPYGEEFSTITHYLIGIVYFLSIVAVNVFIMLSGWFGIRTSIRRFAKFVFQILFWGLTIYAVLVIFKFEHISFSSFIQGLYLNADSILFIKCYLGLMICAPLLNTFVEQSSERNLRYFLLSYFLFEIILGWIFKDSFSEIHAGTSIVSFVGIYLLGRYLRLYGQRNKLFRKPFLFYIIPLLVVSILGSFVYLNFGIKFIGYVAMYVSPLIIFTAAMLLLSFSKLKIKNKTINILSMNVLAVYLIHQHPMMSKYYGNYFSSLYERYSGILYPVYFFMSICIVYLICVFADFIRLLIWRWIESLRRIR